MPVNTVSNVVHESPHVHPDTRARVEHLIKIGCHRIAAIGGGPTRNRRPHTVAPRHGGGESTGSPTPGVKPSGNAVTASCAK
ncbi:LacI family DNA-binding transcriptional regulator [Cutibacterium acnes]|uniref:LacI family DNA-binding transcriptional regulator n=1 Tax=Cutibacterium acnes TaxID=1747 RepID=UPI001EF3C9E2|nr:LacI family DNA-binding transcriptional regulator [Cutibacterium acnes]